MKDQYNELAGSDLLTTSSNNSCASRSGSIEIAFLNIIFDT